MKRANSDLTVMGPLHYSVQSGIYVWCLPPEMKETHICVNLQKQVDIRA